MHNSSHIQPSSKPAANITCISFSKPPSPSHHHLCATFRACVYIHLSCLCLRRSHVITPAVHGPTKLFLFWFHMRLTAETTKEGREWWQTDRAQKCNNKHGFRPTDHFFTHQSWRASGRMQIIAQQMIGIIQYT